MYELIDNRDYLLFITSNDSSYNNISKVVAARLCISKPKKKKKTKLNEI